MISTGIADIADIDLAVQTCKDAGNEQIVLLKCTSSYPALYEEMNLALIPNMKETFGCSAGLSDHSLGDEVALAAVAMGASVVEKHFTLKRDDGGVDADFSMEAEEMKDMVKRIRNVEAAIGKVSYSLTEKQKRQKRFSRSLFVSKPVKKGELFTAENIRSVRPGNGLPVKYLEQILGRKASHDLAYAAPLTWEDIE